MFLYLECQMVEETETWVCALFEYLRKENRCAMAFPKTNMFRRQEKSEFYTDRCQWEWPLSLGLPGRAVPCIKLLPLPPSCGSHWLVGGFKQCKACVCGGCYGLARCSFHGLIAHLVRLSDWCLVGFLSLFDGLARPVLLIFLSCAQELELCSEGGRPMSTEMGFSGRAPSGVAVPR